MILDYMPGMKKTIVILSLIVSLTTFKMHDASAQSNAKLVIVLSVDMHLYYFDLQKEYFEGATLEIINDKGELQSTQVLNKRKTLIDSYEMPPGKYIIKVKKGVVIQDFEFEKK